MACAPSTAVSKIKPNSCLWRLQLPYILIVRLPLPIDLFYCKVVPVVKTDWATS